MRQLWLQDEVKEGRISIEHLPGEVNVAGLLTKPLPTARFEMLTANLGVEVEGDKIEALAAPIERIDGMIPIDLEMWIAEVEDMGIIRGLEGNEYVNDGDLRTSCGSSGCGEAELFALPPHHGAHDHGVWCGNMEMRMVLSRETMDGIP